MPEAPSPPPPLSIINDNRVAVRNCTTHHNTTRKLNCSAATLEPSFEKFAIDTDVVEWSIVVFCKQRNDHQEIKHLTLRIFFNSFRRCIFTAKLGCWYCGCHLKASASIMRTLNAQFRSNILRPPSTLDLPADMKSINLCVKPNPYRLRQLHSSHSNNQKSKFRRPSTILKSSFSFNFLTTPNRRTSWRILRTLC